MKAALFLTLSILALTACTNEYADSPTRHEIKGVIEQGTPTPSPGNPYEPPAEAVSVPSRDTVQ